MLESLGGLSAREKAVARRQAKIDQVLLLLIQCTLTPPSTLGQECAGGHGSPRTFRDDESRFKRQPPTGSGDSTGG